MLPHAWLMTTRIGLAATVLSLGACAAGGRVSQSDAVPRDFAVSVAVSTTQADLEPAWYILEADGTLRAALGAPTPRSPVPPRVRTLTPGARASVWHAVQNAQWIPESRGSDVAEEPADAARVELAEVYVAADGGRWTGRVLEAPDSPEAERLKDVIRELRRLAWLPESR